VGEIRISGRVKVPFADGSSLTFNSPIWISGQQKTRPRSAPNVGEHSYAAVSAVALSITRRSRRLRNDHTAQDGRVGLADVLHKI